MAESPIRPTNPGPPMGPAGMPVHRSRRELPLKPRRVRSGVKFTVLQERLDGGMASSRWLAYMQAHVPEVSRAAGREYAELGQVRSMEVEPGAAHAFVQGRLDSPYRTSLTFRKLGDEVWTGVANTLADQSGHAARLLAGELPAEIDEIFATCGGALFPTGETEVVSQCSCREPKPWCKHASCLAWLVAQRLVSEPLLMLALRGMSGEDVMERVRQRRTVAGSSDAVPVHTIRVPGVSDAVAPPLEASLENFWESGPELRELDLPIGPPQVSHPLLRRLGPSPFTESRFPLVGLLATCYDIVSESVLSERGDGPADDADGDDEPADETN